MKAIIRFGDIEEDLTKDSYINIAFKNRLFKKNDRMDLFIRHNGKTYLFKLKIKGLTEIL